MNRLVRSHIPRTITIDIGHALLGLQWDTFLLWKGVCKHHLLRKATFIVLLNKSDVLDAKIRSGVQFRQFVTSYKERPNRTENILECKSDFPE